jgi:hypothetical protein
MPCYNQRLLAPGPFQWYIVKTYTQCFQQCEGLIAIKMNGGGVRRRRHVLMTLSAHYGCKRQVARLKTKLSLGLVIGLDVAYLSYQ